MSALVSYFDFKGYLHCLDLFNHHLLPQYCVIPFGILGGDIYIIKVLIHAYMFVNETIINAINLEFVSFVWASLSRYVIDILLQWSIFAKIYLETSIKLAIFDFLYLNTIQ